MTEKEVTKKEISKEALEYGCRARWRQPLCKSAIEAGGCTDELYWECWRYEEYS